MNQRRPRGRNNNNNRGRHQNPRNQTFDSNGPGGRVRGSASQVLDRYLAQARDAQAAGDSILAENLFQHAEHYYRVLSAANAAMEQQQRERHGSYEDRRSYRPENTDAEHDARSEDQSDRDDRQDRSERSDLREDRDPDNYVAAEDAEPRNPRRVSGRVRSAEAEMVESDSDQAVVENYTPQPRRRTARTPKPVEEPRLELEDENTEELDVAFLKAEPKPRRRRRTSSEIETAEASD